MTRLCIYKCVFGDYDIIVPPRHYAAETDYVVVTENPDLPTPGWQRRIVKLEGFKSPKHANMFYRAKYHSELGDYAASLYLDGNIHVLGDLRSLFDSFLQKDVALGLQTHPDRTSVESEIEACIRHKLLRSVPDAQAELDLYRAEGFADDIGFFETNVIFKNHSKPGLEQAMDEWFMAFSRFVQRDQFSLPYAVWKTGVSYTESTYGLRSPDPKFISLYPHWPNKNKIDWLNAYIGARRYENFLFSMLNQAWTVFQVLRKKASPRQRLNALRKK